MSILETKLHSYLIKWDIGEKIEGTVIRNDGKKISRDKDFVNIEKEFEDRAKEILELSDLVKFAKYKPDDKENQKILTLSREFIEGTMVVYEIEEQAETIENVASKEVEPQDKEI